MGDNLRAFRRAVVALALSIVLLPLISLAHPMGNFSINHYSGIRIARGFVELQYLIDMAEIPTFQEFQQNNIIPSANDPRVQSYLSKQAETFRKGLLLTVNGQAVSLETISQEILFSPGAGSLPTMKFGLLYRAQVPETCTASPCELEYSDANFSGRLGWKEVIVAPSQGVTVNYSSAPSHDRSHQLSDYPTDLINSAPQDVTAKTTFWTETSFSRPLSSKHEEDRKVAARENSPASSAAQHASKSQAQLAATLPIADPVSPVRTTPPPLQLKPNQQFTPRNRFTELIATQQISLGLALLAAVIAAGLGAAHALEPGHGKTIVAAYLVGSRGTARHALLLGMIVTTSHTAGVYLLGAVTVYAQKYILPERIYPFLAVLSGILIAGMGCYLFLQRFVGAEFTHSHDYELSRFGGVSKNEAHPRNGKTSARQLLALGVTGGIVPCPAALVVLLSATALHRTAFGLYLIVAFSIGLAAVLIAMGLGAVYAGNLLARLRLEGPVIQRWLPLGSAAMIVLFGFGVAVRGLVSAGIVQFRM